MKIWEDFLKRKTNDPANEELDALSELAQTLLAKVEVLRDVQYESELQALSDANEFMPLKKNFDFYDEIQRFEIYLIKQALNQTNGCQKCAARLLNLKVTTLNTKIKHLGIQLVTTVGSRAVQPFKHDHADEEINLSK